MITELLNLEELYGHDTMKGLIDNIAQSSIMRLDSVSMDRLWDLITMVFKWQVTMTNDVLKITTRHLYEIETFTTNPDTQLQLHRVQNVVDNFNKILTADEKIDLTEHIRMWLRDFEIRVSLLLRLGFQRQDGSFKFNNFEPKYSRMLNNIGENIYAAAKSFNIAKEADTHTQNYTQNQKLEKHELNAMINQILGEDNKNTSKLPKENTQIFKLSLCESYEEPECEAVKIKNIYSQIDVSNSTGNLQDIFNVNTNTEESTINLHDELLNIIDENC